MVQMTDLHTQHHGHHRGGGGHHGGDPQGQPAGGATLGNRDDIGRQPMGWVGGPVVRILVAVRRRLVPGPVAGARFETRGQPVPRRRPLAVQSAFDHLPQCGRRRPTGVGQQPGHFMVLGHFDRALHALVEVSLDHLGRLLVDGIERIGTQQLLDLPVFGFGETVGHCSAPAGATPRSARLTRRRPRPDLMRLLTVPSGSSSITATCR